MQYIQISSTSMREVVGKLLELGKLGAVLNDSCAAFKVGPVYQCRVVIGDDAGIQYDAVVRKGPSVATETKTEYVEPVKDKPEGESYTKEELEDMTLAEVRKATGISDGGKQKIIEEYLNKGE